MFTSFGAGLDILGPKKPLERGFRGLNLSGRFCHPRLRLQTSANKMKENLDYFIPPLA